MKINQIEIRKKSKIENKCFSEMKRLQTEANDTKLSRLTWAYE